MSSIFLLVREGAGPRGHGEPGEPYLAVYTSLLPAEWFTLGEPAPAFATEKAAQSFKDDHDRYGSWKIKEFPVVTQYVSTKNDSQS